MKKFVHVVPRSRLLALQQSRFSQYESGSGDLAHSTLLSSASRLCSEIETLVSRASPPFSLLASPHSTACQTGEDILAVVSPKNPGAGSPSGSTRQFGFASPCWPAGWLQWLASRLASWARLVRSSWAQPANATPWPPSSRLPASPNADSHVSSRSLLFVFW